MAEKIYISPDAKNAKVKATALQNKHNLILLMRKVEYA
jgi:hypothetical protein